MKAGVTVSEFWDQTPLETQLCIEAASWNHERRQKELIALAWYVALFNRQKVLRPLQTFLVSREARSLEGEELEKRREEFKMMKSTWEKTSKMLPEKTKQRNRRIT